MLASTYLRDMRHASRIAVLCLATALSGSAAVLLPSGVLAQQDEGLAQPDEGFSLMDEGARLFLRGLMNQLEPTLDDLEGMARELEPALRGLTDDIGPALTGLLARIDDIRNYEAPVILDNGDILLRRRPDAPPLEGPEPEVADEPSEQIDI